LQNFGLGEKTSVLTSEGDHDHPDDGPADMFSIFAPAQAAVAREYLAEIVSAGTYDFSSKGLTHASRAKGSHETSPPPAKKRSKLLSNHKPQKLTQPERKHRVQEFKRELQAWLRTEQTDRAELFVFDRPAPTLRADKGIILFTCKGMVDVFRRYDDETMSFCFDIRQSCAAKGWGVATVSFFVEDKLHNTTLKRMEPRHVQAKMPTSHALHLLQAALNIEAEDHITHFSQGLVHLWDHARPGQAALQKYVIALHKRKLQPAH